MRATFQWVVLIVIAYTLVELCSYGGLYVLDKYRQLEYEPIDVLSETHANIIKRFIEQGTNYVTFSPKLGWSIKENGLEGPYRANSSGIRSNREYTPNPPPGIFRLSTFGDSFTHGDDVQNLDTWQRIIEDYDPDIEVLNYGVGGYGLDQAFLRYSEEESKYKSHAILIGFMSENIYRNVNTFRPFYFNKTSLPLAKPRFLVTQNRLSLVPSYFDEPDDYKNLLRNPKEVLEKLGTDDYYYENSYSSNILDWSPTVRFFKILANKVRSKFSDNDIITNGYYNTGSEAFRVTRMIFDEFHSKTLINDQIPIIVIFPSRHDVIRYQSDKTKRYTPILTYFESMNYKYIDLMDAIKNSRVEEIFNGHYTPKGNRLIAHYIHEYLTVNMQDILEQINGK